MVKTNFGPVRTLLRDVEWVWDKFRHVGGVIMDLAHVKTFWRGSELIWDMPEQFGVVGLIWSQSIYFGGG